LGRLPGIESVHEPEIFCLQRYKQLLYFATKLQPLGDECKVDGNKVKGCVSQVWVVASLQPDGTIQWQADSDSQLTKVSLPTCWEGKGGLTDNMAHLG